jgi:hypothetical protein
VARELSFANPAVYYVSHQTKARRKDQTDNVVSAKVRLLGSHCHVPREEGIIIPQCKLLIIARESKKRRRSVLEYLLVSTWGRRKELGWVVLHSSV